MFCKIGLITVVRDDTMVKHDLIRKYFHGCGDCRACCDGKLFSMGTVTFSDFKKIVRLFPTVFDPTNKKFLFMYSLTPMVGCHYFRDNKCSIYNTVDRPDTCLNFPFGLDDKTVYADYKSCPNLNDTPNDFPIIIENGTINPRVMNEFFTEFQYVSHLKNNNLVLEEFVDMVFISEALKPFPSFKTTDGEVINIREIDANKNLMILDIEKITKIVSKMNNLLYNNFIHGHLISLENLPQFGKRLLQQI